MKAAAVLPVIFLAGYAQARDPEIAQFKTLRIVSVSFDSDTGKYTLNGAMSRDLGQRTPVPSLPGNDTERVTGNGEGIMFSSGNGQLVRDTERLKKFLSKPRPAIMLTSHTSVPAVLKAMLQPTTLVILKRDVKELEKGANPVFLVEEEETYRSGVPLSEFRPGGGVFPEGNDESSSEPISQDPRSFQLPSLQ